MESQKLAIQTIRPRGPGPCRSFQRGDRAGVPTRGSSSRAIPDHLLIDVADYAHVPDGRDGAGEP